MTTLIWAGHALTAAGQPVQIDYAVCVEGNHITDAGSYATLRMRHPDATQVGGHDFFMLPAMTNSHDHGRGLGTLQLGVPDDLLEIWLPGLYSQPGIDWYLLARYEGQLLLRAGVGTTERRCRSGRPGAGRRSGLFTRAKAGLDPGESSWCGLANGQRRHCAAKWVHAAAMQSRWGQTHHWAR